MLVFLKGTGTTKNPLNPGKPTPPFSFSSFRPVFPRSSKSQWVQSLGSLEPSSLTHLDVDYQVDLRKSWLSWFTIWDVQDCQNVNLKGAISQVVVFQPLLIWGDVLLVGGVYGADSKGYSKNLQHHERVWITSCFGEIHDEWRMPYVFWTSPSHLYCHY